MSAAATDLLLDQDNGEWLAAYQSALASQPRNLPQVTRIRRALTAMGYVRTVGCDERVVDNYMWRD